MMRFSLILQVDGQSLFLKFGVLFVVIDEGFVRRRVGNLLSILVRLVSSESERLLAALGTSSNTVMIFCSKGTAKNFLRLLRLSFR